MCVCVQWSRSGSKKKIVLAVVLFDFHFFSSPANLLTQTFEQKEEAPTWYAAAAGNRPRQNRGVNGLTKC